MLDILGFAWKVIVIAVIVAALFTAVGAIAVLVTSSQSAGEASIALIKADGPEDWSPVQVVKTYLLEATREWNPGLGGPGISWVELAVIVGAIPTAMIAVVIVKALSRGIKA